MKNGVDQLATNRCLQLYHNACMSLATKSYTQDTNERHQKSVEMAQCSFRPVICPLAPSQPSFPQPNAFDSTILRLRRGRELRASRSLQLAPRIPMSVKKTYQQPISASSRVSDTPRLSIPQLSVRKDPVVLVEVTKDCIDGGVSPVGTLRVRMKDNIEELACKFGREYKLSKRQTTRLYEQLEIALNNLSNSL